MHDDVWLIGIDLVFQRLPHGCEMYHASLEEDLDDATDAWEKNGKTSHSAFLSRIFIYLFIYSIYLFGYLRV